jgi:C4-type Zn-finger protein
MFGESWFHRVTHHFRQTVDDYVEAIKTKAKDHPKESADALIEFLALHKMVSEFDNHVIIKWNNGASQVVTLKAEHTKHINSEKQYLKDKYEELMNFFYHHKDLRDAVRQKL